MRNAEPKLSASGRTSRLSRARAIQTMALAIAPPNATPPAEELLRRLEDVGRLLLSRGRREMLESQLRMLEVVANAPLDDDG